MKTIPVLYPKQKRILNFIQKYVQENGHGPALTDIAHGVGLKAVSTVHAHLERLQKKGVIRRDGQKNILFLESGNTFELPVRISASLASIPLLGIIAAGLPIEAIEDRSETIEVDPSMLGRHETYALRVRGQSMQDHHICDGDIVVVEKQDTARNGETVVALLDDGTVTLKDFYKEKSGFRLQPRNPAFPPIHVKSLRVQGRVIGLLRRYENR